MRELNIRLGTAFVLVFDLTKNESLQSKMKIGIFVYLGPFALANWLLFWAIIVCFLGNYVGLNVSLVFWVSGFEIVGFVNHSLTKRTHIKY